MPPKSITVIVDTHISQLITSLLYQAGNYCLYFFRGLPRPFFFLSRCLKRRLLFLMPLSTIMTDRQVFEGAGELFTIPSHKTGCSNWKLFWLITRRLEVRVLPPLPSLSSLPTWVKVGTWPRRQVVKSPPFQGGIGGFESPRGQSLKSLPPRGERWITLTVIKEKLLILCS